MPMMRFSVDRIVAMPMGMEKVFMTMPVTVLLSQQRHHACGHKASGHQQLRR